MTKNTSQIVPSLSIPRIFGCSLLKILRRLLIVLLFVCLYSSSQIDTSCMSRHHTTGRLRLHSLFLVELSTPFGIVQDEVVNDEGLRAFDLLILPNVEHVSEEQLAVLYRFVEGGGSLLITERSGVYNGRARRRTTPAFAEMFASALATSSSGRVEAIDFDPNRQFASKDEAGVSATATYGSGRAAYLAEIAFRYKPRAFKSHQNVHYDSIDSRYWKTPYNVDELLSKVRSVLEMERRP